MKKIKTHKNDLIFKQILATALLLLVLLSSCSLKRGVKVLFDIPVKTERTGALGHHIHSLNHGETACFKCSDLQVVTADSFDHSLIKNISSAIFISVIFSLLMMPFFKQEETHHFKIPTLGLSIPKYLLFSKLLFYDIR